MDSFFCPDTFQGQPSVTDDGIGKISRTRNANDECEVAYIVEEKDGNTYLTHETKLDENGIPVNLVATGTTFEEAERKLKALIS